MELDAIRQNIDQLDRPLWALFIQRMELAAQAGAVKQRAGLPIDDPAREQAILAALGADSGELEPWVRRFFQSLFALSRDYQHYLQTKAEAPSPRYGLLGQKLAHSWSPHLHRLLGRDSYQLIELEPPALEGWLARPDWQGVNVTLPYKQAALAWCDQLNPAAARIGSINTIVRDPLGRLWGYNTDLYGFNYMLHRAGLDLHQRRVLILGSGGTARTAQAAARQAAARSVTVVSRQGPVNYRNAPTRAADTEIIINTTPVGMYPLTEAAPVDLQDFPACRGVIDVIYNPAITALLHQAQALGLPATGGLPMLVAQAAATEALFKGQPPEAGLDAARLEAVIQTMEREHSEKDGNNHAYQCN